MPGTKVCLSSPLVSSPDVGVKSQLLPQNINCIRRVTCRVLLSDTILTRSTSIVDACVEGYQARITGCQKGGNDYICLCDVYRDVLTCYNNCPDSSDKPPVQNQVTQFCLAAEPYVP